MVDPSALSDKDLMALIGRSSSPIAISAGPSLSHLSDADLLKAIEAPVTVNPVGTAISNVASQFGKGLTFGWLDEGVAASAATENAIASLFGRGNGGNWNQNYDEMLGQQRAVDKQFAAENPKTALGLNIAGAVAPAVLSLGATAPASEAGLLSAAMKSLYGVGTKGAPTLGQLVKMGAVSGALTGAGESEDSRLGGALLGGSVGAVAAPVIGKTISTGTRLAGDFLAENNLIPSMTGLFSPNKLAGGAERGSISNKIADVNPPGYSPEEIMLAKQLKNTPLGKVAQGQLELQQAVNEETPLFLPEAVKSPKVDRNAQFIANYEPSIDLSKSAIEARAAGAGERINRLMDAVSAEVNPTEVGTELINASKGAIKQLETVRKDATSPMYKALEGKLVPDDIAIGLMEDPVIESAITSISKTPAFKKQLGKSSPGSFEFLNLTKQKLDDEVDTLMRAGNKNEAHIVRDSRDKVVSALEKLDDYRTVTDRYKELSKPINKLAGTQDESGLLEGILNTDRIKAHRAPAELLKLTPTQIESVKDTLGEKGVQQLKQSARSLMQDILAQADENSQPALKLLKNSQITDKFRAMMGNETFDKFAQGLGLEKRMAQGRNKYFAGSPTQGLQQENADFDKGVGFLSKLAKGNYKDAIAGLFGGQMPDEVAKGLSKIYFDPKRGNDALIKILPLLEKYSANKGFAEALGKSANTITSREAGSISGGLFQKKGSPGKKALGLLGASAALSSTAEASPNYDSEMALERAFKTVPRPDYKPSQVIEDSMVRPSPDEIAKINDVKSVEDLIDQDPVDATVYKIESNRNPEAKNKTSSAAGGFQLISSTARKLGVKDPFKLGQNYAGYLKLKEENKNLTGDDPELIYSAHYLGAPVLAKVLKGKDLSDSEQEQVDYLREVVLPRFRKEYAINLAKAEGPIRA